MNFFFLKVLLLIVFLPSFLSNAFGSNKFPEITESPQGVKNKISFYRTRTQDLLTSNLSLQKQLNKNFEGAQSLKKTLLEQQEKTTELTTELSKNREEILQFKQLLKKSSLEKDSLNQEMAFLRQTLKDNQSAMEKLTYSLSKKGAELIHHIESKQKLSERIEALNVSLQEQLEANEKAAISFKKALLEQQEQTTELTTELSKNREESEQFKQLLKKSSLEKDSLNQEMASLRQALKDHQFFMEELKKHKELKQQLGERIEVLNESLRKESEERARHQALMAEQNTHQQELLKEKQNLEKKIQEKKEIIKEKTNEINQYKEKLEITELEFQEAVKALKNKVHVLDRGYTPASLWRQRIRAGTIGLGAGVFIAIAFYNPKGILNWFGGFFDFSSSNSK